MIYRQINSSVSAVSSKAGFPWLVTSNIPSPVSSLATLHADGAFWSLLLPNSDGVNGDIWRGFAQPLLRALGKVVVFGGTSATRSRLSSASVASQATSDSTSKQAQRLLQWLQHWRPTSHTPFGAMEELWIGAYKQDMLQQSDVQQVQLWLHFLQEQGFPRSLPETMLAPPPKRPLNIVLVGVHVGTDQDMGSLFHWLGHKVSVQSVSGSCRFASNCASSPAIKRWQSQFKLDIASESVIAAVADAAATEDLFKTADVLVTAFFPTTALITSRIAAKTGSAVIFISAHRFNLRQCTKEHHARTVALVRALHASKRGMVVANNPLEAAYIEYHTGLRVPVIHAQAALYLNSPMAPPPKSRNILVGPAHAKASDFEKLGLGNLQALNAALAAAAPPGQPPLQFLHLKQVQAGKGPRALAAFPAALLLPYAAMSQSITEVLSLGVPVFVPSPKLLQAIKPYDLATNYCDPGPFEEFRAEELKAGRVRQPNSTVASLMAAGGPTEDWLGKADFYQYAGVTAFDTPQQLFAILYNHTDAEGYLHLRQQAASLRADVASKLLTAGKFWQAFFDSL